MSAPLLFGHLPVPPLAAWSLSDLWKSVVSVGKGLHLESVGQSWLSVTLWSVGVLLGVAILVATYWGIFQRSERRLTWVLMLLRGAGLLALLLALAKPTWTGETQLVDPSRVAIVLDNSESMAERDPSGPTRYARATEALQRVHLR